MSKNYNKYRLVLSGDIYNLFSDDAIRKLVRQWPEESGVKDVSSGCVRCDLLQDEGVIIYSAHFDSSHWTGIGFEGFDKKHPGVPATL